MCVARGWDSSAATASPVGFFRPSRQAEGSPAASSPAGEGPSWPAVVLPGLHGATCREDVGLQWAIRRENSVLCIVLLTTSALKPLAKGPGVFSP